MNTTRLSCLTYPSHCAPIYIHITPQSFHYSHFQKFLQFSYKKPKPLKLKINSKKYKLQPACLMVKSHWLTLGKINMCKVVVGIKIQCTKAYKKKMPNLPPPSNG